MRRKELFYYVTSGSNVRCNVHWYVTVFYQQIENGNIANQIHGFTIDYGKFILISVSDFGPKYKGFWKRSPDRRFLKTEIYHVRVDDKKRRSSNTMTSKFGPVHSAIN